MKKSWIVWVVALVVVVAVGWYFTREKVTTISADTSFAGYVIKAGEKTVVKNNAVITVNGDFTLDGKLACSGGSLKLIVTGNATLNGVIECGAGETAGDVSLVLAGSAAFSKEALIEADGNIQIVKSEERLATTPDQIGKLYDDAGANSGKGPRIGPLADSTVPGRTVSFIETMKVVSVAAKPAQEMVAQRPSLVSSAYAQAIPPGQVIIAGNIRVATPPRGVKRIVVINIPEATGLTLQNFTLTGPDGREGQGDIGQNCNAQGKNGEDAFRFLAYAPDMRVDNFTLNLGSGGNGGNAETKNDCEDARATGGNGGQAGNFKMIGANNFAIEGAFLINPGRGGNGGSATANGKNGDQPGKKGGDATAKGGNGANNNKKLGVDGTVGGLANVQIGSVIGGNGGLARANPGTGGQGDGCESNGGKGGNGTATGGKGGNASLGAAGVGRAPGAQDNGGNGGDGNAVGGKGGDGGNCDSTGAGGDGGDGGDAKTITGKGGTGTTANGNEGVNQSEQGGNGGDGGDGCPPGKGGQGGKGNPEGEDGKDGENKCIDEEEEEESRTSGDGDKTVKVINYNGKYLPVDQLIIEDEQGCGAEHWHAAQGVVKATDGSMVSDPGPQCGYGKVKDKPVMNITVPAGEYEVIIRGLPKTR